MDKRIPELLAALFKAIQAARIYPAGHPSIHAEIDIFHSLLIPLLETAEQFTFGIHGHELICEDDILPGLQKQFAGQISRLEHAGIGKITFLRGVDTGELARFVHLLPAWRAGEPAAEQLREKGITRITAAALNAPRPDESGGDSRTGFLIKEYGRALEKLGLVLNSLLDDDVVNLLGMKYVLNTIMTNLADSYHLFLLLARVKEFDDPTYIHSLNVSILAMNFANHLHISPADSRQIGAAGFLHDVGKMQVDRQILNKPGKLVRSEMALVEGHTRLGAGIILRHVQDLGRLPAIVAFEHHLRHDMTGYPKCTFVTEQHIATGIVCLCDVYDALIQKRAYKDEFGPRAVYDTMRGDRGTLFHPDLFDEFFRHFGIWPRGTAVRLADGHNAVVVEENPDNIGAPVVRIAEGDAAGETADLSLGGPQILAALDPRGEGERYLEFPVDSNV